MAETGRPAFTDEQYQTWLDEMRPFLITGCSLYHAIEKTANFQHKDAIYEKYRLNDWFSEKVNAYRSAPGEKINNIFFQLLTKIEEKIAQGLFPTGDEVKLLCFYAEKHRTAQPFFVNRQETAVIDLNRVGKVLDKIEAETDYGKLAQQARRALTGQVVETNAPVQDQKQTGATSDVPAEPNTATPHSGESKPQT